MIIGIVSDIHGNLPAFEAVAAKLADVDRVICLGDVVNYGPWSNECLELLQTLPMVTMVEGNHEALFLGKEDLSRELPLVQQFFEATIADFRRYDLIRDLPEATLVAGHVFTHTFNRQKIYPDTPFVPPHDSVIGHSHCAFNLEREGRRLINPGSVGQNRSRLEIASYGLLDSESGNVELHSLAYPVDLLLNEMRARNYPAECLAYYLKKM